MNEKFPIGTVVTLKCGGPSMTISSYQDIDMNGTKGDIVNCRWFDGENFKSNSFNLAELELESDE